MNAIEQNAFTAALGKLGRSLPLPKAICVVSAHWVTRGCHVLTADRPRTIHDFYGFPPPLYEVQYPAPGAPEEAKRLVLKNRFLADREGGFDHGAWTVLRHLYPEAQVRVFQLSLDHARTLSEHFSVGGELRELRRRGVLLLASGNLVHNLHRINWEMPRIGYAWAEEFDGNVRKALLNRDVDALVAPERWGSKLLGDAHPTLEHYAPLLYGLGASDAQDDIRFPYEGLEYGTISMRMVLFEPSGRA